MDIKSLVRNKKVVHDSLDKVGSQLLTKTGCKIYIPVRYAERQLAVISSEISIVGIFAIVVDDKYYGVSKAIAMMRIEPTASSTITVGEEDYYEFYFEPGSVVIADTQVVKEDTLCYFVYDYLIAKGNVPFFLNYVDLATIFENSVYYTGLSVGANHAIMDVIVASISRQEEDRTKYYRQWITKPEQLVTNPPAFIPFKSVIYGATNTTARLMGSYFEEGLTSALVNPSERLESVEELLRR